MLVSFLIIRFVLWKHHWNVTETSVCREEPAMFWFPVQTTDKVLSVILQRTWPLLLHQTPPTTRDAHVLVISGKCLFLSGFTEEQLNHMHDNALPAKYKMGFTNMVARATPGSKDLSRCRKRSPSNAG